MIFIGTGTELGTPWSQEDSATLRGLYNREASVDEIAAYLNRDIADVRRQATEMGLTLVSFRHPIAA